MNNLLISYKEERTILLPEGTSIYSDLKYYINKYEISEILSIFYGKTIFF